MNRGVKFKKVPLGRVVKYYTGKIQVDKLTLNNYISTNNMLPNGLGITKAISLPSNSQVNRYSQGDILISNIRPYFKKIWFADKEGGCSTDVLNLRVNDNINKEYIYYCLSNDKFFNYIMLGVKGAKMPRGDKQHILKYNILLPILEEQDKIVSKIKLFDEKIYSNSRLIEMFQKYLETIFYKWFIDFNFLNNEGKPYKDSYGRMKISKGKEIPLNWEIKELNEVVEIVTELINPQDTPKKIFKHYSIPVFDDTKSFREELGKNILSHKYKVNGNNLLVSKLNPWFKRIIYSAGGGEDTICSKEFAIWRPLEENLLEYLYVIANTERFTNYCINASFGTSNSHKRVNSNFMLKYKVLYHEEIVKKFNNMVKPIVEKINLLFIENKSLREEKDLLIKKLIK